MILFPSVGTLEVCLPHTVAEEEAEVGRRALSEGDAEVYNQTSRPGRGVCLAPQCLLFGQACISNVIYYSGDVCPSSLSDEKALFSKVYLAGMYTQDRLLYLSYKPG